MDRVHKNAPPCWSGPRLPICSTGKKHEIEGTLKSSRHAERLNREAMDTLEYQQLP